MNLRGFWKEKVQRTPVRYCWRCGLSIRVSSRTKHKTEVDGDKLVIKPGHTRYWCKQREQKETQ